MQSGTIRRARRNWYVLYWQKTPEGRKRKRVFLATVSDQHPTKDSVPPLAESVLKPYNNAHFTPEATMSVLAFIERAYLPFVKGELRRSTHKDYGDIVRCHFQNVGLDKIAMSDFRTVHAQRLVNSLKRGPRQQTTR